MESTGRGLWGATVGLIITEGTQPSDDGQGYPSTPGIYTDAHVRAWSEVTEAVHARGAKIFFQLMHAGRMSHPDNTPHHRQGVAPSAIAPGSELYTLTGMKEIPVPRALSTEEVRATVDDYRFAARRAIQAGADGVEIHGIAYRALGGGAAAATLRNRGLRRAKGWLSLPTSVPGGTILSIGSMMSSVRVMRAGRQAAP